MTSASSDTVTTLRCLDRGLRLLTSKSSCPNVFLLSILRRWDRDHNLFDLKEAGVAPRQGKTLWRFELETDPRHAKLLIQSFGLQRNSRRVHKQGERPKDSLRTVPLSLEDASSYRSNVMRLAYLAAGGVAIAQQGTGKSAGRDPRRPCQTIKEMHSFLIEVRSLYPGLRTARDHHQARHLLQWLKLCWLHSEPQKHWFMQNLLWETHLLESTSSALAVVSLLER